MDEVAAAVTVHGFSGFRAYEMTPPLPEKIPAACRRELR